MKPQKVRKALTKKRAEKKQRIYKAFLFVMVATVIRRPDDAFLLELQTFCSKIDTYTATLGLVAGEVTAVKNDLKLYAYVLQEENVYETYFHNWVQYKLLLRYGHGTDVLGAIPAPPALPLPLPTVTTANMQKRFADLIQKCVQSSNFTNAIGEDLGIIAPATPFDPSTGKPVIKIVAGSAGHPRIIWKKGKFQGVNVYKNTGTGYIKLDFDDRPDYIDKSDLPALGTSAVWKYKLIYVFNSEEVGEFSDEVVVT